MTFRRLLERFGTAEKALAALPELARRGGRRALAIPAPAAAEAELAAIERLGAGLLCLGEAGYPDSLAAIEDAPPAITLRGAPELLRRPAVALVGARNASGNGRRMAERLAEGLAAAELVVVSGLARGIDAAAHRGALAASGATVAVLAGGLDHPYPPENRGLSDEIAARGLLLAELPLGTVPQARHFPRRNRIISGLSLAVVVVEAAQRSGSLITARLALEQGREVLAVPGSPLDPRAQGGNRLIREGATLVESAEDVLESLGQALRSPRRPPPPALEEAAPGDESELGRTRAAVMELLSPAPLSVDEVVRRCQLSAALVHIVLLELELGGRLERQPGNRVALAA